MPKYGEPIWSLVLKAAKNVPPPFSAADIIREVHKNKPEVPSATLGTYVRAMAPNHPSSSHYPSTRANHGYFTHLGEGRFRLKSDIFPTPVPVLLTPSPPPFNEKETFLAKNRETILRWLDTYKERIIKARGEYAWADNSPLEALEKRREISRRIVLSRIRNGGSVDIETINAVMDWGGLRPFPKEPSEALCLTKKAFDLLDSGDLKGATLVLLGVSNFGIASASKVLGLFDGDHYCIYDSRVGTALKTLRNNGKKLILAPSGRGRRGDNCPKDKWAVYYERLIWVMEVIRDQLNLEGHPFSIADIEMALFMIGK